MALVFNGTTNVISGVSVGGLPDGIVDTDMLAANAVTEAKATGSVKGILNVHQFRVTANFTQSGNGTDNDITANWEKVDDAAAGGTLGSFSDPSSGVFTFPSTGIWRVDFNSRHYGSSTRYAGQRTKATTDGGSSYDEVSQIYSLIQSGYVIGLHTCVIMDVTNVSTHKIKFVAFGDGSDVIHSGSSTTNNTYVTFIRLGDT